jgi:hypothetical protein
MHSKETHKSIDKHKNSAAMVKLPENLSEFPLPLKRKKKCLKTCTYNKKTLNEDLCVPFAKKKTSVDKSRIKMLKQIPCFPRNLSNGKRKTFSMMEKS